MISDVVRPESSRLCLDLDHKVKAKSLEALAKAKTDALARTLEAKAKARFPTPSSRPMQMSILSRLDTKSQLPKIIIKFVSLVIIADRSIDKAGWGYDDGVVATSVERRPCDP